MTEALKLRRARALHFERSNGQTIIVAPVTIQQITDCVSLDPAGDDNAIELPLARLQRIASQVRIFVPDASVVESLTLDEAQEILQGIFAHVHGYDPGDQLALQALLKKKLVGESVTATAESSPLKASTQ